MATEQEIHDWLANYPRQWNQLCQALMWQLANRFGTVVSTPPSAIEAYHIELNAGRIAGGDAPPGSFVYWAIGQYGHVGFVMNDGRTLMATGHLQEEWVDSDAGWNTSAGYERATGARSLGWSYQNGGNSVPFTVAGSGGAGGGGTPIDNVNYHWYDLSTDAMWQMQDMATRLGVYDGLTDGDFGPESVTAMQQILKNWGYLPGDYDADGVPHNENQEEPSNYGFALQTWAKNDAGYDGLMDGLPGSYTSEFLVKAAQFVKAKLDGTTPPPEPEPEPSPIPPLPPVPAGHMFFPDLGTSQSAFDFAEYAAHGGIWDALKMGGGNASDSPYTAPAYRDQLQRSLVHDNKVLHYWFNGRKNGVTPQGSADYFAQHSGFAPGHVAAMDIEDEIETDTKAWSPAEAVAYARRLDVHYPGVKGLFYLSLGLYDSEDWSELEALGWMPWIARWGDNDGDPNIPPPSNPIAWQYTSEELVPGNYRLVDGKKVYQRTDGNIARADLFELLGYVPKVEPEPEPGDDTREVFKEYLEAQSALNAEFAAALV